MPDKETSSTSTSSEKPLAMSKSQKFWTHPATQFGFWFLVGLIIAGCIATIIILILMVTGAIQPAGGTVVLGVGTNGATSAALSGVGLQSYAQKMAANKQKALALKNRPFEASFIPKGDVPTANQRLTEHHNQIARQEREKSKKSDSPNLSVSTPPTLGQLNASSKRSGKLSGVPLSQNVSSSSKRDPTFEIRVPENEEDIPRNPTL